MNGGAGQQIIFGGAQPGPQFIPGGGGGPPMFIPGGGGGGGMPPQISVKVNAPKINFGGVRANGGAPPRMNMGGGAPSPARMNMGGGVPSVGPREINMVRNAGGPEAVRKAVTALKRANGNVNAAMNSSGLPRQTFVNVKNMGGVNAAPRIAAAVTRKRTTKRKKKTLKTNRIKKIVHKVPRKNLEKFVLLWALRRKR